MVDGKIAFSMGSTVPTLERGELVLPLRREEELNEIKPDTAASALAIEAPPADVAPAASATAEQTEGTVGEPIEVDAAAPDLESEAGKDLTVVKSEPLDPMESVNVTITEARETEQEIVPVKPPRDLTLRRKPAALPLPTSLFIGDLRLTLLRTRLQSLTPPIPAEFAGSGILICGPGVLALSQEQGGGGEVKAGSIVAVRKGEKGVEIEGSVGGVYDQVRKEVYGSFAQVSA